MAKRPITVDQEKWVRPAVRSDISGPTVAAAVAVSHIHKALGQIIEKTELSNDQELKKSLEDILLQANKLSAYWVELVGTEDK